MDGLGGISKDINSTTEMLQSLRAQCCGYVCLHSFAHTARMVASWFVPLSAEKETRQLPHSFQARSQDPKEEQTAAPCGHGRALGVLQAEQGYSDF